MIERTRLPAGALLLAGLVACSGKDGNGKPADVNEAPVFISAAPVSAVEHEPYVYAIVVKDPDLPAQRIALAIDEATSTCPGTLSDGGDGTGAFTFTPGESDGGTRCVVGLRATDELGLAATQSAEVTIAEVNAAPVNGAPPLVEVDELTAARFDLAPTDSDLPEQELDCVLVANTCPGGTLTGCAFEWIPSEAEGPEIGCEVTTRVEDGVSGDEAVTLVVVREVNIPPYFTSEAPTTASEGVPYQYAATAEDDDLPVQPLVCSVGPADTCGGSVSGCEYQFLPAENQGGGTCIVDLVVDDGQVTAEQTVEVSVAETNLPPAIGLDCPALVGEHEAFTCALAVADEDRPVQALTCSVAPGTTCDGVVVHGCTAVEVAAQGELAGPGGCAVAILVDDGVATALDLAEVAIEEVNAEPTVTVSCPATIAETAPASCTIVAADADVPAQAPSCRLGAGTTCTGATITGCDAVSLPAQGESAGPGSCTVVVEVSDGAGGEGQGAVVLELTEENVPPVDNAPAAASGPELSLLTIALAPSDADFPEQELTCSIVANTCAGGSLNGCVFEWTPTEADGPGTCAVTTRVSDGIVFSEPVETIITLDEVQVPPSNHAPLAVSGDEQTPLSFALVPSDPDLPEQPLACSLVWNTCAGGDLDGCVFEWTPTEADGPGTCTVTTVVHDGVSASAPVETVITIAEVNEPPTNGAPATVSGDELAPIWFEVAPADPDLPAQALTCAVVSSTCSGGAVAGCIFVWLPTEAEGPATCTVVTSVSDGVTGSTRSTEIEVREVNVAPTNGAPASIVGDEETLLSFSLAPADPDLPAQELACSLVGSTCAGGSLTGCVFEWTPTEAEGPATCTVTTLVSDGVASSAPVTTTVTVNEVPVPPAWSTAPTDITVGTGTVYAGYNGVASDPDLRAGRPDTLNCSRQASDCTFPVAVSGWGSGTASCQVSFAAGTTAESCHVELAVTDASGGSIVSTFAVNVEIACSDGVDNDGDGAADYPDDPGCSSPDDPAERGTTVCDDGLDNDGDGQADSPLDEGCTGPSDTDETTVWYVDVNSASTNRDGRSWSTALAHPQEAMDLAGGGDQIWVADGTYRRQAGGTDPVLWVKARVQVYGGFAGTETSPSGRAGGPSVLDGEDASEHVVIAAEDARLDGFTIMRGNAVDSFGKGHGGGLLVNGRNVTVADCLFTENYAAFAGGAIFIDSHATNVTITGCSFIGNDAALVGGAILGAESFVVRDSIFESNSAFNLGGAVATSGGTFTNCLFHDNTVGLSGGALFLDGGTSSLMNCTIVGSAAGGTGAAIMASGVATMSDSIVWENPSDDGPFAIPAGGALTVTHSLVQGGWPGTGNINADPRFVTGPSGSFYLNQTLSPAVNAGSGTAVNRGMSGKTTSPTNALDTGVVDLGFHYEVP